MAKYEPKNITRANLEEIRSLFFQMEKENNPERNPDGTAYNMRTAFFSVVNMADNVPAELVPIVQKFSALFYSKDGNGYHGVMEEIRQRTTLYAQTDGKVRAQEFILHSAGKTDIYDRNNRIPYELKTGCGDWLRSYNSSFSDILDEYRRKRTRIKWDYVSLKSGRMDGKKSVNNSLSAEEKEKRQERSNPKKAGKQYPVHIHIDTTFRKLFDYMATYPAGIETFFKESTRSGRAGVYVWEMQTIKNSKRKIQFFQYFNTWDETGVPFTVWEQEQKEIDGK